MKAILTRLTHVALAAGTLIAVPWLAASPVYAEAPVLLAQATPDPAAAEKEAFDAAKELGTAEAWQAFVKNFPTGFRADLARAYISKLETAQGTPAAPAPVAKTVPPSGQGGPAAGLSAMPSIVIPPLDSTPPGTLAQPPMATKLGVLDLGPGTAPWQNGTVDVDDGSRRAYAAEVAGNGMELIATCVPPKSRKDSYALSLMLRENPRGVYPEFDTRLQEGMDGAPAVGPDFRQIVLRFDGDTLFEATGRVFGMTGELEISSAGKPLAATGKIVDAMMGGRTMTVLADPFSGTFQLSNSRPALCSVLAACGAKIGACKGVSAPKVSSKPITTQPKLVVPKTATQGAVPPPPGFVPSQQGYVPPQQPQPFVPLSTAKSGGTQPQGGATLVIQQTATGPCPDPQNQVRNSTGQCVCNVVSTQVGGKCVKACVGATRDLNGNCQCPAGQIYHPNGYCIDGTNEAALQKTVKAGEGQTCPDGRLRDVSGVCLNLCSGERVWNGQKCIGGAEAKNYYCRDLGIPEKGAEDGACKAAPSGGLTVKLVPSTGTAKGTGGTQGGGTGLVLPQGTGEPVLQLFQGLLGGTQPQGGGGTTQPKVVTCTGGQVPQADGKCACPSGQTYDGKTCVVDKVVRTQDATGGGVTTLKVTCTGGQLPQADGKCACPGGQAMVNGKCPGTLGGTFTQTKTTITCTGGQIPQNGACACPSGQQFTGGKCVAQSGGGQQGLPGVTIPNLNNLLLSDQRAKTDVSAVATLAGGIRLYAFRYRADDTMRVGVMAQDLLADERTRHAVHTVNGLYAVDYAALGLRMATLAEWQERGVAAVLVHR